MRTAVAALSGLVLSATLVAHPAQLRRQPDATPGQTATVRLNPDATFGWEAVVRLKPDATFEQDRLQPDATVGQGAGIPLAPGTTSAQRSGTAVRLKPGMAETAHVAVTTSVQPMRAGGRIALIAEVRPKPNMHVYAPGQVDYIPVSLKLQPNPSIKADAPRFPPAERFFFAPLEETQLVYSKPFRIVQDVTLASTRAAGNTVTVKGTLNYQACDEEICYMPVDVPLAWTVPLPPR